MRNIVAIWQREMKSYFVSPIAYVVITIFVLLNGIFFSVYLWQISQVQARIQEFNAPGVLINALDGWMSTFLLFLVPMLTMGLFAEEKRRGTIELLLTTPLSTFQTIAGKYIASVTLLIILIATHVLTISPLFFISEPDYAAAFAGYVGLFLFGMALLAIGLFISILTENQIIAVTITFGLSLILFLIDKLSWLFGSFKEVIEYLSLIRHLEDFQKGILDTTHIFFYVTFIFVGLYLAYRSIEAMRWKD